MSEGGEVVDNSSHYSTLGPSSHVSNSVYESSNGYNKPNNGSRDREVEARDQQEDKVNRGPL